MDTRERPVQAPKLERERPGTIDPLLAQRPAVAHRDPENVPVPVVPMTEEAPELAAVTPTSKEAAHTVGELLTAGMRERVLDTPADTERPLDGNDAVALADKGLKGITGGNGGVQVQRGPKRDRFKVRLGEGLAFSGSIGR